MTPLLLVSSSHSPLTICSGSRTISLAVHDAPTTQFSATVAAAAAARRCLPIFGGSGVSLSGYSATSTPLVVRSQLGRHSTMPMHRDEMCKIFYGTSNPKVSKTIADMMGKDFEIIPVIGCGKNVQLPGNFVNCHVYLLHPISTLTDNSNEELISMIDSCLAGGARSITAVMPFSTKIRGREVFDGVKQVANRLASHDGYYNIMSFDFYPRLAYENPPPNISINAETIMRHYLEHNHMSDLVIVTSQNSEGVDCTSSSFKKDFQPLAVVNKVVLDDDTTAEEVEFVRDVGGNTSAILIGSIPLSTEEGIAFLGSRGTKNVYTRNKDTDSVLTEVAELLTNSMVGLSERAPFILLAQKPAFE